MKTCKSCVYESGRGWCEKKDVPVFGFCQQEQGHEGCCVQGYDKACLDYEEG